MTELEGHVFIRSIEQRGPVDGASPEEVLLVDDYEKYVHPGQEGQWIKAPDFDYPYSDDDLGLKEVSQLLRIRAASS